MTKKTSKAILLQLRSYLLRLKNSYARNLLALLLHRELSQPCTNNKGLSPEYWTERIMERLIAVSDNADPMVKAQADAFKQNIQAVVLLYMKPIRFHLRFYAI